MQASRTMSGCLGEEHFGGAQLDDARRERRLVDLANQMVKHPGGTLPDKLKDPAELKALCRLVTNEEVIHQAVLQPHIHRTLDGMRAHQGVVLILHDTTEFLDSAERHHKKYVVRSQHNRWVLPDHENTAERVKLHDLLRSLPEVGQWTVRVPARGGQPARTTTEGVAWAPVRVLPPRQARGEARGVPLKVWVVRVWELNPRLKVRSQWRRQDVGKPKP